MCLPLADSELAQLKDIDMQISVFTPSRPYFENDNGFDNQIPTPPAAAVIPFGASSATCSGWSLSDIRHQLVRLTGNLTPSPDVTGVWAPTRWGRPRRSPDCGSENTTSP